MTPPPRPCPSRRSLPAAERVPARFRRRHHPGGRLGSSRLLLVGVLAAVGLLVWLGWLFLVDPEAGAAASSAGDAREVARPGGSTALVADGAGAGDGLLEVERAGAAVDRTGPPTGGRRERRDPSVAWVSGRVLLPDGTPLDEVVFVEARESGGLGTPSDREPIDARGRFRVAFSADSSIGWLRVHGRYVWYPGSLSVRPGRTPEEELQLEPVLGGRIEGTLVLGERATLPEGELVVDLEGSPDSREHGQRQRQVEFEVVRDQGGLGARFAASAVPPGTYTLESAPDGFFSRRHEPIRVEAGGVATVDLELFPAPTVRGRVVDPEGEPVAEAEVSAFPRSGSQDDPEGLLTKRREATTDSQGHFELRGIDPVRVELQVQAEGFVDHSEAHEVPDLVAGGELRVALSYGGTLAGRVIYPDGEPAPGARVTAKAPQRLGMGFGFRDDGSSSTETDAEGRFFLSALGDGPFELLSSTPIPGEDGHFVARLEDVEVDSADVVLTLGPGFSLSGRVFDMAGDPVERYALSVRPEGTFSFLMDPKSVGITSQRIRDEEGRFSVEGLLPGTWALNIVAGGYGELEETKVTLPPQPPEIVIRLFELSTLKGTVRGPDGRPVAKADVRYRVEGGGFNLNNFGDKSTNRRGQFRFGNVPPGSVRLEASAPGFAPARPLVLEIGQEDDREDLVLLLGVGARIEGSVVTADGNPAVKANVSWSHAERGSSDSLVVDDQGRFRAEAVPAGSIRLTARIPYSGPGGESRGTTEVELERFLADRDVWTPVLRQELPTLQVATVHVTRNGAPWADTDVVLTTRSDGSSWTIRGETDEAGSVRLEVPGPGTYDFTLGSGRNHAVSGVCELGSSKRLDFDLSTGAVVGRVVLPEDATPMFVQVVLKPLDPDAGPYTLRERTIDVDGEGAFQAGGILVGRYTIQGRGPTLDQELLVSPSEELRVTRDRETGPLELTLSERGEMSELGDFFGGR